MSKKVEDIKKVGVVGAGTMGSGIAQVVASNGREVVLVDVFEGALEKGVKAIEKSLGRLVKKESISEEESGAIVSRITATPDFDELGRRGSNYRGRIRGYERKKRYIQKA